MSTYSHPPEVSTHVELRSTFGRARATLAAQDAPDVFVAHVLDACTDLCLAAKSPNPRTIHLG
jgi:hypothetical protein